MSYSPLECDSYNDSSHDEDLELCAMAYRDEINGSSDCSDSGTRTGIRSLTSAEALQGACPTHWGWAICYRCSGVDPKLDSKRMQQIKTALAIIEASIAVTFCYWFQYGALHSDPAFVLPDLSASYQY
jgi:hypothetical protein